MAFLLGQGGGEGLGSNDPASGGTRGTEIGLDILLSRVIADVPASGLLDVSSRV